MSDLAVYKSNNILSTYDDVSRAAEAMARSGYFEDAKSAAQAIVKIMAGHEIGIGAFASMSGIHIVKGKPTIGANVIAATIKSSKKYNYTFAEFTEKACELIFFELGKECGRSRFTIEEATRAGLTAKDVWKNYPKNLLFARAISNGAKWFCPDLFNGSPVYTAEEMGSNVDGEGNYISVEAEYVKDVTHPQSEPVKPTSNVKSNWHPDILAFIANWTGKSEKDVEQVLALSKVLEVGDPTNLVSDWVSLYVNERKAGAPSAQAATTADNWLRLEKEYNSGLTESV